MKYFALYLLTIILFFSCNSYKTKYPYSLDDFRPELRQHLEKIVTYGGACSPIDNTGDGSALRQTYSYFISSVSESELEKLLNCEHPVLRAYSFKILCTKKSPLINIYLLNHLDDTAQIAECAGEFGTIHTTVADAFLEASKGNTSLPKKDVIKTIVTNHPYLISAAFLFIYQADSMKQYYSSLKNMYVANYPLQYAYRERLLAQLSSFKNPDDTTIIKNGLVYLSNEDELQLKFNLIEKNPSPAFYFAIEKYYNQLRGMKYRNVLDHEAIRSEHFSYIFAAFINAVASYKSERSAVIFDSIVKKQLYYSKQDVYEKMVEAMQKYPSPVYRKLLSELTTLIRKQKEETSEFQMEKPEMIDSEKGKTTW